MGFEAGWTATFSNESLPTILPSIPDRPYPAAQAESRLKERNASVDGGATLRLRAD
jgi:hypothetical protein